MNKFRKTQQGFGLNHLLLLVAIVVGVAAAWKYQQRKSADLAKQQEAQKAAQKSSQIAERLVEINQKIEADHNLDIEIQKRVYEKIGLQPPVPDQSDITSKHLPLLAWKATSIDLSKALVDEFSKAAKGFVLQSLKDPDSAKFSDMKIFKAAHSDGGYTFICGKVNAKNSYGGYTGFENFVVYRRESNMLDGGVGDKGAISAVRSEGKWWKYDGDDMCFVHGFPVDEYL